MFQYKPVSLSGELFSSLGFNPRLFREGAHILLMSREDFLRFGEACGTDAEGGIYPLAMNGDAEAVLKEEIPFLPDRSRNIVLPDDHLPLTLVHEIMHDIFIGGGLTAQERQDFTKELLYWRRLSLDPKMPHQHKNQAFYQTVAEVCMKRYDLKTVTPKYYQSRHYLERDFKVFAGECFAYAGEFLLFPNNASFRNVPDSIIRHLKFIRVINPQAIRQANGQA
jgi:hypothetical protein